MRKQLATFATIAVFAGFAGIAGIVGGPSAGAGPAPAVASAGSGNWGVPDTWVGGVVPPAGAAVTIADGHTVVYDQTSPVLAGLTIDAGATLEFAGDQSLTLESTGNVLVEGTLAIRPSSGAIVQTLRFVGVNEGAFVGGGMDPVDSDVGLWVMGAGNLDIAGTPKAGWVRAAGDIAAGATSVALGATPAGWQVGDEVVIAPTEPPTVGSASYTGFDEAALTSVGQTIGLSRATARPHPKVNGRWTAEVANLSRNVRIEGTPGGRSHVFIRSSVPQVIDHAELRYLGVEQAAGRYPLHIHMSENGSRNTEVDGTVVRDGGHHAFVVHNSHGVTLRDTVAYNIVSDAYWWDPGPHSECPAPPASQFGFQCPPSASNDIVYDHALAAKVLPGGSGLSVVRNSSRLAGFELTTGTGDRMVDSVAVGVQGTNDAAGFEWNEGSSSVWTFNGDNRTHNNKLDGIFNWQNSGGNHVLADFSSFHNGHAGVDHGAYNNRYQFRNATLYGNGQLALKLRAVSPDNPGLPLQFENVVFDGGGISPVLVRSEDHRFDGTTRAPTLFLGSTFQNAPVAFSTGTSKPDALDVVNATISTPSDFVFDSGASSANVIRVQPSSGQPFAVTPAGRTNIPAFYPYSTTPPTTTPTTTPPTTAPPGGTSTTTVNPTADAYVEQTAPTTNFGTSSQIAVDGSPVRRAFLKFTITNLTGNVTNAKLRLHVKDNVDGPSENGGTVQAASNTSWSESAITWNTPLALGSTLGSFGAVARNQWVTLDITPAITGNGTYTLGMTSTNTNGAFYDSRETSKKPELIVTTSP